MFTMKIVVGFLSLLLALAYVAPGEAFAQDDEISRLQNRVASLESQVYVQSRELSKVKEAAVNFAPLAFLFGAFCALWAQNTGRNAWLWFFLGAVFSVFAVLGVLVRNEPPEHNKSLNTDAGDAGAG